MTKNPHIEDADKMINFFSNIRANYESMGMGKGLVSFCLDILNVSSFDMKLVESSLADLQSIMLVISRDLTGEHLSRFNSVVKEQVDKMDMWLHGVYNHKIAPTEEDLFFGDFEEVNAYMKLASKKVLRDDYFDVYEKNAYYMTAEMDDTSEYTVKESATDEIGFYDGMLVVEENPLSWTQRNVIFTGNKQEFENKVTAKYASKHDKRLVMILKGLFESIGDAVFNKVIRVQEGSLKSDNSYRVNCKKLKSGGYDIVIEKV